MEKLKFDDLEEKDHVYSTVTKKFIPSPIKIDYVKKTYKFAYDMTFGEKGEHRKNREKSLDDRNIKQIFLDAFEGKLAEFCFYNSYISFNDINNISPVDVNCYKKNKWDEVDFITKKNGVDKYIGIKSSKEKAKVLLLETSSWIKGGAYKYGKDNKPCKYDAIVFVRIKYNFDKKDDPHLEDLLNSMSDLFKSKEDDNTYKIKIETFNKELEKILLSKSWFYDIPGFITNEDLCFIIDNNKIMKQGYYFNQKVKKYIIKADNYYIQIKNLRPWITNAKRPESAPQSSE